jgi:hypothetical protein
MHACPLRGGANSIVMQRGVLFLPLVLLVTLFGQHLRNVWHSKLEEVLRLQYRS